MSKKQTIRSHYLPQTYLKHFLLNDALFMYKKGEKFFSNGIKSEDRIVEVSGESALINVGLENNLYKIDVSGLSSDDIEEFFQQYGENLLNDVILSIENKKDEDVIGADIKDKLCVFLATMRIRTPFFKWETEEIDSTFRKYFTALDMGRTDVDILKKEMEKKGKNYTEEEINIVRQALIDKKYKLKYPNEHFLQIALSGIDSYIEIFRKMTMAIFKSRSDRYFITSDNPVVYFVPQEKVDFYNPYKSLVSPYTEVFFPLTRNIAVHLSRRETKEVIMNVGRENVDLFNYNISHNSFNFLFSPLKMSVLNEFIKQYIPYPFKVNIS